jgi:hypothetical protein
MITGPVVGAACGSRTHDLRITSSSVDNSRPFVLVRNPSVS